MTSLPSQSTVGLYYGSSNGATQHAADLIADALKSLTGLTLQPQDIRKADLARLPEHQVLLLGCSTWDIGELQYDWEDQLEAFQALDLTGVQVGFFGCGDQYGYPETFQDALGILAAAAQASGAALIGKVSTAGYDFGASRAVQNNLFVGLPLDEDNQPELTPERVQRWGAQVVHEAQLPLLTETR
ncbi:flavodoxin [Deinococcus sp. HMF7604]|uniref:flavodoxin n=1 Tax=Deinococcus betulae TaxID=2873312 RepID=UPI001CCB95BC|nr:flavodoxin [Deinococcus betulae]MBZ9753088.1 flavodoxin [Deinococcus betulae]